MKKIPLVNIKVKKNIWSVHLREIFRVLMENTVFPSEASIKYGCLVALKFNE